MAENGPAQDTVAGPEITITRVTYERLVNTGNYQNFKVGAEAAINIGGPAEDALAALRLFVDTECLAMTEALKRTDGLSSSYPSDLPPQLVCAVCGEEIKQTRFRDGTVWSPEQLAGYGNRKHGSPLCLKDYRLANQKVRTVAVPNTSRPNSSY